MNRIAAWTLALVFALLLAPAWADTLEGHVIHVADGDTITVLNGKEQIRVRIGGIDAPERRQAFSRQSTDHLSSSLVHSATDHLDLTRPSVLNGVGAAVLEALTAGGCGDIRHESPPSEMLGAMAWSVYCSVIDARAQWIEEKYGEAAADEFYSAIEDAGLEWNNRAESAKAAKRTS